MAKDLQKALDNLGTTYDELVVIANDISSRYTKPIDDIINTVDVIELSNDDIRRLLTELSFKSYSLGEAKEQLALKSEIADALMKEKQAVVFNGAEGTVDAKKNKALLDSSEELLVNSIFETVASLLKTKLDETHRIVSVLTTVITSRNAEAKLNAGVTDNKEGF